MVKCIMSTLRSFCAYMFEGCPRGRGGGGGGVSDDRRKLTCP